MMSPSVTASYTISPSADIPIDRRQLAALRAVLVLSNPHSRNGRAAPRFSPTRSFDKAQDTFIPSVAPAEMIPQLDY